MTTFENFSQQLRLRFEHLSQYELFTVALTGDEVWATYLASFPEGTNPIFRERTEHDCSCCRNFVRSLGNVVGIVDGSVQSIWDIPDAAAPYDTVSQALAALVETAPIVSLYRTKETKYGAAFSFEAVADGAPIKWNHFHGSVAKKHLTPSPEAAIGEFNTTAAVFKRGLTELRPNAFETVLGLIHANALYRGEEFLQGVQGFAALQTQYLSLDAAAQALFIWQHATNPATRFRNTAMGTLIIDLSEGMELETAVSRFEKMVAPTNYKRPTALITPRMIEDALKTVDELGLREALERRFATLSDISVNNVIWADNSAKAVMKDGLAGLLLEAAAPAGVPDLKKAEPISIADFIAQVVPGAQSLAVLVRNAHQGNLMSLTAPVHADSGQLFKWGNDFAWSYNGNLTDSIKEKVKRAGGNTEAKLRISLAWFNADDLDIHVYEPNGNHIYFANKSGKQDIDMNAGGQQNAVDPVENVSFAAPLDGVYRIGVHQYNRRSTGNPGFVLELESNGAVQQFSYAKGVPDNAMFVCGEIEVRNGSLFAVRFSNELVGGSASQRVWGTDTEQFQKVETLMFSPNHWDGEATGNKHWFFILEGCRNDQPARGIYNEYLASPLDKHRKVFEVLGAKTMCAPTAEQLSGLGFSSTKGDVLTVKAGHKLYNVQF
jgi:hypothetical protein